MTVGAAPPQLVTAVTAATFAVGTWLTHETATAAGQVMDGEAPIAQAPILMTLALVEIAPMVESARPSSTAPVPKLIAPAARIVPRKTELPPKSTAPLT